MRNKHIPPFLLLLLMALPLISIGQNDSSAFNWKEVRSRLDSTWKSSKYSDSTYWKNRRAHSDSVWKARKSKADSTWVASPYSDSSYWDGKQKQWKETFQKKKEEVENEASKSSRNWSFGGKKGLFTRYTRGSGWYARPEFYSGIMGVGGYQVNPNIQLGLCLGFTQTLNLGADFRFYMEDKANTTFFDLKWASAAGSNNRFFAGGLFGYSMKNIDLGVGVGMTHRVQTDPYGLESGHNKFSLLLSIGYNFRFYETTISRKTDRKSTREKAPKQPDRK